MIKPEPIVHNIETAINFGNLGDGQEHHSLYEMILNDAMHALGVGTALYWAGTAEGLIYFETLGGNSQQNTSLISGADGATNYLQITATYVAPEATTVETIYLVATKNSRVHEHTWSEESVSQALSDSQSYIINWTIHADI